MADTQSEYICVNLILPGELDRVLQNLGNDRAMIIRDLVRLLMTLGVDMSGIKTEDEFLERLHALVHTVKMSETLESHQTSLSVNGVTADLLDFIEMTRERFYNEHRRYQVLARIRKVLREQLFERFPSDSTNRSLITTIINATNRTTAKNFRVKYLNIFRDSLEALREGRTDYGNVALLQRRLLEIDDEL